jgi:hypothetical protein
MGRLIKIHMSAYEYFMIPFAQRNITINAQRGENFCTVVKRLHNGFDNVLLSKLYPLVGVVIFLLSGIVNLIFGSTGLGL